MANEIAYSNRANDLGRDQVFSTHALFVMPAPEMYRRRPLLGSQQCRVFDGKEVTD
jgi:hypothetical protein